MTRDDSTPSRRDRLKAKLHHFSRSRSREKKTYPEKVEAGGTRPAPSGPSVHGSSGKIKNGDDIEDGRRTKADDLPKARVSQPGKVDPASSSADSLQPSDDDGTGNIEATNGGVSLTVSPPLETENNRPETDLWHEAFLTLSNKTRHRLKDVASGNSTSSSIKEDLEIMKTDVQQKQDLCAEKAWKIRVKGQDIIVRDYASRTAAWLTRIGDVVVPFLPPQASPPWGLVKGLLQVTTDYDDHMLAILATVEKVSKVIHHGRVYESVYTPDRTPEQPLNELHSSLVSLYAAALELLAYTRSQLEHKTPMRVVEALVNPDKASGLFAELDSRQADAASAAQDCEMCRSADADTALMNELLALKGPLARIDRSIMALFEEMNLEKSLSMLEWISNIPYTMHHDSVRNKRTQNTCEWLLRSEVFRNWEESSSPAVFWLWGAPGVGKTYLTSKVIDHTKAALERSPNHEGLAFFYCNRAEEIRRQPLSVVQSFVRQLATTPYNSDLIQKDLTKAYYAARKEGSNFNFAKCKELLLQSFNLYPKTTLVLDALDECDPSSRQELIGFLAQMTAEVKNPVKIFISSRPDNDIQNQFRAGLNFGIRAEDNHGDIEVYIKERLPNMIKSNRALGKCQEKITRELLERSGGMFQWTFLQLEQLKGCKSEDAIKHRLKSLPKDLKGTYDEIYRRIQEEEDPLDKRLADRAFIWVMAAARPLTSEELLCAIRIDPHKDPLELSDAIGEDQLLAMCRHLLVIDPVRHVWRFSHLSVTEYFEKHHWSLLEAHLYAGNACLLLLNDAPWLLKVQTCNDDSLFDSRSSFNFYVRNFWPVHVRAQDGHDHKDLLSMKKLLERFFGTPTTSSPQYRLYVRYVRQVESGGFLILPPALDYLVSVDYEDLMPENCPMFGLSRLGIYHLLKDWWGNSNICLTRTNREGKAFVELAASANHFPLCEFLVRSGAPLGTLSTDRALLCAIERKNLDIIRLLTTEGKVDGNASLDGLTVLEHATLWGNLDIVKYLATEAGSKVDMLLETIYQGRGSALMSAVIRDLDILRYFVSEVGVNINIHHPSSRHGTVLAYAAVNRPLEVVKYLVNEAGADINLPIRYGLYGSALAAAAGGGRYENVVFLTEAGANLNMPLQTGNYGSALEAAAANGNLDIVKYLVEAGANVNIRPDFGKYGCPLCAAFFAGDRVDDIKLVADFLLRNAQADVNHVHSRGMGSALASTAAFSRPGLVEWLIKEWKAEVDLLLSGDAYSSALCTAAFFGHYSSVKCLIENGASVQLQVENQRFSNALEAAKTEVTQSDSDKLRHLGLYGVLLAAGGFNRGKSRVVELLESLLGQ